MQYSSNYQKKSAPGRGRKRKKTVDKRILLVIAAVVVAVALIVSGVFIFKHYRATHPVDASAYEKVESQPSAPSETQTEAPTEAQTEMVGDVTVTPYKAIFYSTTTTLNVRSAPTTDGAKLGMVGQDTPLSVTGRCSNGWYRIDYNGGVGYVSGDYVTEAQSQASPEQSDSPYLFKVNRKQNIVIAYAKDADGKYTVPKKAMVCSVGIDGKTPTGTFQTTGDKYDWRLLSGNVYGQYATRINGPYLFHSVPYFTKSKSDLEYDEYNKLGEAASLGCIRLSVEDAKWVQENCPKGTTVIIYDSDEKEPLPRPTPTRIDTDDSRRGWDPTDPDTGNPWR